jgi:DDE superfamily endonuclease
LEVYATTLHDFGAQTHTIFGFIDCTIQQMCRPVENQGLVNTGYKKYHGMKFQAVATPDRLITYLAGLSSTPQNDSGVLKENGLLGLMERHVIQKHSQEGDPPILSTVQGFSLWLCLC